MHDSESAARWQLFSSFLIAGILMARVLAEVATELPRRRLRLLEALKPRWPGRSPSPMAAASESARPSLVLPARADTDMARPRPTEARARKGRCGHGGDASDWPAIILRRPSAARLGPRRAGGPDS